nr:hypothetical protein [uncultured Desulfobacter sp.]
METIKFTTGLVFLPVFFVASMATYFNMIPLIRLEYGQKSGAMLVNFKSSIALMINRTQG